MKQFLHHITFVLLTAIFALLPQENGARQSVQDFEGEIYRQAIQHMVDLSGGTLDREGILRLLYGTPGAKPDQSPLLIDGDTIYTVPVIAVVHYDSSTAVFSYFPQDTFYSDSIEVSFPENPGWVVPGAVSVDSIASQITIEIQQNTTFEPRSTSIEIEATINGGIVSFTAYILQQPAPQHFLLVSPKYAAIGPDGGSTAPFVVTHFNIGGWRAFFTAPWISVDSSTLTQESVTFVAEPYGGNQPRQATVTIADTLNPTVSDELVIFQFVDTSAYIVVSPSSSFIGSGENSVDVSVLSNIEWQLEYLQNPGGMIADTVVGSDQIIFDIAENTGPLRTAIISLSGTQFPDVTAEIQIVQAANAPAFIFVSPENTYADAAAGNALLNIDANVNWFSEIIENPAGMITAVDSTLNSISFAVAENTGAQARTATGRIRATNDPALADTFRIIQQASFILPDPAEVLLSCEGGSFYAGLTLNNVDSVIIDPGSFPGNVDLISDDSLIITVPANTSSQSATYSIQICSFENPAICASIDIFQYACSQTYLLISPREQVVDWNENQLNTPFVITLNNTGNPVAESLSPWIAPSIENDTLLQATIEENAESTTRTGWIRVFDSEDLTVADTVKVVQSGAGAWIIVTPEFRAVPYSGGYSQAYTVESANVDEWEVIFPQPAAWISEVVKTDQQVSFRADTNTSSATRFAQFHIRKVSDSTVMDSAIIFQGGAPEPQLLAAPREQLVGHQGSDSLDFQVVFANISGWQVDPDGIPEWITIDASTGNLLSLDIAANPFPEIREAILWIEALNDPSIRDSVRIFQYSGLLAYLLAAPREQMVLAEGNDSLNFGINAVNVDSWQVDSSTVPEWLMVDAAVDTLLSLDVMANTEPVSRNAVIRIQDVSNPAVMDSVSVFQHAANEHYLLAAPREQRTGFEANSNITFQVSAVNVASWQVDPATVPEWMEIITSGASVLTVEVSENNTLSTRSATLKLFADDNPSVTDSVSVYQYPAFEAYLIAAPREQNIQHTGNPSVNFQITRANVTGWQVDESLLPPWVDINTAGAELLSLNVLENTTLGTREAVIRFFATENPSVADSVHLYQFSGLDPYLITAPREQLVSHGGADDVQFAVTRANVESWNFDNTTVPSWIDVTTSGNDQLVIAVSPNSTLDTRQAAIRIFSSEDETVEDFVLVYQYSGLDSYLLAAPREQRISHAGENGLVYAVTAVNTTGAWEVDPSTVPSWIVINSSGGTNLNLDIQANPNLQTRQAQIRIFDPGNETVEDMVSVYQFSTLDAYLLAAPREQKVGHSGTENLIFMVTGANVLSWETDPTTVPQWVTVNSSGGIELDVDIAENTSLQSRQAAIRVFDPEDPQVEDIVTVYQYAGPDRYLLAAPREQSISHEGDPAVNFSVTAVNTDLWVVDESTVPQWIAVNNSGNEQLSLNVQSNNDLQTRVSVIGLFDADDPGVRDSVSVYQYSGLSPYILIGPLEQDISHLGGNLAVPFTVTTTNIDEWDFSWDKPWIDVTREGNQLFVTVDSNAFANSRIAFIKAFDVNDTTVFDQVSVFQGSGSEPYIIIQPAAFDSIPSAGDVMTIRTFSNLNNYYVSKEPGRDWYEIDTESLSLTDSVILTVSKNESSYLSRSSYLMFESAAGTDTKFFYFQQQQSSDSIFITISGNILINGNPENPLTEEVVYIGEDSVYTDNQGKFTKAVLNGWKGAVTPKVTAYFYEPVNVVFEQELYVNTELNFAAIPINPQIEFSTTTTSICAGETLMQGDPDYPVISTSGTYGQAKFRWISEPGDPNLPGDTTDIITRPALSPDVSTRYSLVMYNYGTSDTASFDINVFPVPEARDFSGLQAVCRNQAGTIYVAENYASGEYFRWSISGNGGTFVTEPNTSIAIINWGNTPGEYVLSLYTYNEYGCSQDSISKTIVISEEEAPPSATVLKKSGDNMLMCSDADAFFYEWGWYQITDGQLDAEYIIEGRNDWYCRLPHEFDPVNYKYFVITHYEDLQCTSRSFFNPPVDIQELASEQIRIFPNPSEGILNISLPNGMADRYAEILIYNSSGQQVYRQVFTSGKNQHFTADLKTVIMPGLYFVRVVVDGRIFNSKLIIK